MPQRMTIREAQQVFASLMATARRRPLTPHEKSELSYARQQLRADRKEGRRNPRKKISRAKARQVLRAGSIRGRRPPRKNPGRGLVRMGKLVELRYQRDHGRAPGYYKHTFTERPAIYYDPSTNSILVKG